MARMIPPYIGSTYQNRAEEKVFKLFKECEADWTVLHSFNIPETDTSFGSEIDFLVLAPNLGLFCLEVKGGEVTRKEGIWTVRDRKGRTYQTEKGPFRQAENAMYNLIGLLKRRFGHSTRYAKLLISHGVVMIDMDEFRVSDGEIETWRIYDRRRKDIAAYIEDLSRKSAEIYVRHQWFDRRDAYPGKADIEALRVCLRGDFEKPKTISLKIKDIEQVIASYTEEQYACLDGLEENPRCLFKGPAGTGKTMLALEAAKRSMASGDSTLLTCYNKLLAGWLRQQLENESCQDIKAMAFLDFLEEIAKGSIPPGIQKDHEYYTKDLPLYALEALDSTRARPFDKIIIDEGQDILRKEYLDVIDVLLKDGISGGKWDIFCDFEKQNIFNEDTDCLEVIEYLRSMTCFTTYKLKTNCRNSKEVAQEIFKVIGFSNPGILKEELSGIPVRHRFYIEKEQAGNLLVEELQTLKRNKVEAKDITILSPHILDKSSVRALEAKYGLINLSNAYERFFDRDSYTYSTIHKFKGMENAYIILVDLEELDMMQDHEDYFKSLLYIGMSRAKAGLIMLVHEKAKGFLNLD